MFKYSQRAWQIDGHMKCCGKKWDWKSSMVGPHPSRVLRNALLGAPDSIRQNAADGMSNRRSVHELNADQFINDSGVGRLQLRSAAVGGSQQLKCAWLCTGHTCALHPLSIAVAQRQRGLRSGKTLTTLTEFQQLLHIRGSTLPRALPEGHSCREY